MTQHSAGTLDGSALRQDFTSAMRRLIATVTIITSGDQDARAGMVATAVMSVSADPPSLAVGINREAGVWQAVQDTGRFSVNLLATHHAPLVYPFSGQLQGEERFTLGQWHTHASKTPYLADAVVSLFCRVDGKLDYGTHTLFIGAVDDIRMNESAHEPLLWRNGSFANAVPLDELLGQ
jgi:flavin reductase (DIM6/NTAB) family NADH-FMN oxidoreductase RutF